MKYKIGILMTSGTPIVLEFDDKITFDETLERLRQKNTLIEIEQNQMMVAIRTENIVKTVSAWAGKDFDIVKHL